MIFSFLSDCLPPAYGLELKEWYRYMVRKASCSWGELLKVITMEGTINKSSIQLLEDERDAMYSE